MLIHFVTNMDLAAEQCCVIHFYVRLPKLVLEMVWMMKEAYEGQFLGTSIIFKWNKKFSEEWESLSLIHGGQAATVSTEMNVNSVAAVIREDQHQSVQTFAESLHISKTSVHWILTENLGMKRVRSMWVPHFLTITQMDTPVEICQEWITLIENNPDFFQ